MDTLRKLFPWNAPVFDVLRKPFDVL